MERLSLGYEELSAINPRLVYCSVSAFGETGPLRDEAGYEAIMQAYSGVMSVTGEPEGDPVRCGLSFIDLTTGIISAYSVLGALLHRERTGQGQKVETSLLETAVSLLSYHAEAYLLDGTVPERLGSGHPSMVPYRNFQCRDGRFIFIAARTTACGSGFATLWGWTISWRTRASGTSSGGSRTGASWKTSSRRRWPSTTSTSSTRCFGRAGCRRRLSTRSIVS